MSRRRAYLHAFPMLSAPGAGAAAVAAAAAGPGVLAPAPDLDGRVPGFPVGRVRAALEALDGIRPERRSRNNALAWAAARPLEAALAAVRERFGPGRVGVVVGTSTSGMREAEEAFRRRAPGAGLEAAFRYAVQEVSSPALFLAERFGLRGPAFTVSTACTSSAKALAAGRRLLAVGACDAVLCGGADTLCRFTLEGFAGLEALSPERALPFSRNRRGINIGEGAAFTLLSAEPSPVLLAGVGESSDAHHVTSPRPDGAGAEAAMRAALADAGMAPSAVGYLNLHGTATPQNDAMEARATARVFPGGVPASSTKPATGHALGAAGALEAALCHALLVGELDALPRHAYDGADDPELPALDLVRSSRPAAGLRACMSNSFAFGGSNVSLILERA